MKIKADAAGGSGKVGMQLRHELFSHLDTVPGTNEWYEVVENVKGL